jgi:hypothetical protein
MNQANKIVTLLSILILLPTGIWANWLQQGECLNIDKINAASHPRIEVSNGVPYVAWGEYSYYPNAAYVYVKHFNGAAWIQDGGCLNNDPSKWAVQPSMKIHNSIPYVAFCETNGQSYQLIVKHFDGASWIQDGESLNVVPERNADSPSLAFINSMPYVAWTEDGEPKMPVKHFNGTSWVLDGQIDNHLGSSPCLASLGNTPYIAYNDFYTGYSYVYVKHFNGNAWVQDGGYLNINSTNYTAHPTLIFHNATPFVTWSEKIGDHYQVYVKHFDGVSWIQDGRGLYVADGFNAFNPRLVFYQDEPWVTWWEERTSSPYDRSIYVSALPLPSYSGTEWIGFSMGLNNSTSPQNVNPDLGVGDNLYIVRSEYGEIYVSTYSTYNANTAGLPYDSVRAFPNPARSTVRFLFVLEKPSSVKVSLYNFTGERIAFFERQLNAYNDYINWDCSGVAPGIYLVKVNIDGKNIKTLKMAIIK